MNKYLKTLGLTLFAGLLITMTSNANSSYEVGTTNTVKYRSCENEELIVNPQFMVFRQRQTASRFISNLLRVQMIFLATGNPNPDDILKETNIDLSKFDKS